MKKSVTLTLVERWDPAIVEGERGLVRAGMSRFAKGRIVPKRLVRRYGRVMRKYQKLMYDLRELYYGEGN